MTYFLRIKPRVNMAFSKIIIYSFDELNICF